MKTGGQSLGDSWRKRRMVGYQGLSERLRSQRQLGTKGRGTQTGTPSAPATCATEVSEVITRSRFIMMAAVSMKAPWAVSNSPRLKIGGRVLEAGGWGLGI